MGFDATLSVNETIYKYEYEMMICNGYKVSAISFKGSNHY